MCFNVPESSRLVVQMKRLVSFQQAHLGLNLGIVGPQLELVLQEYFLSHIAIL